MSATHFLLGASAVKSRLSRLEAMEKRCWLFVVRALRLFLLAYRLSLASAVQCVFFRSESLALSVRYGYEDCHSCPYSSDMHLQYAP